MVTLIAGIDGAKFVTNLCFVLSGELR